jgi:hypothetical protein
MSGKHKKPSKAELNKDLRRIFARHRVDLTSISFSANPSGISMSGTLLKQDGSEFSASTLMPLVEELSAKGYINTDLSNWDLTGGTITKKEDSPSSSSGGGSGEQGAA